MKDREPGQQEREADGMLRGQALEDMARAQAYELELRRYDKEDIIEIAVLERVERMREMRAFMAVLSEKNIAVTDAPSCEWGSGEQDVEGEIFDLEELEMELGHPPSEEELEDYLLNGLSRDDEVDYDDIVAIARELDH